MARTKQTPVQGKYSKTPLCRHTNYEIDRASFIPRTPNYVSSHARRLAKYRALKAKWEADNPNEPYPHQPPQPDSRRGAAARKFPHPTHWYTDYTNIF